MHSLLSLDLVDSLSSFEPVVVVVIVKRRSRVVANRALTLLRILFGETTKQKRRLVRITCVRNKNEEVK